MKNQSKSTCYPLVDIFGWPDPEEFMPYLSESSCAEVAVHICEKFEWILIDKRCYCSYYDYTYTAVKADSGIAVKCMSIDPCLYIHELTAVTTKHLLEKIFSARAFTYDKKSSLCYSNPYYGAGARLKNTSSAEEAIILLDLYVQH